MCGFIGCVLVVFMHQSIETLTPQPPGHSGELNINPVLKNGYFPTPVASTLLKSQSSGGIQTPGTKTRHNSKQHHLSWTWLQRSNLSCFRFITCRIQFLNALADAIQHVHKDCKKQICHRSLVGFDLSIVSHISYLEFRMSVSFFSS